MAHPIYPFSPQSASAVTVEVQRLDADHLMRQMPPHGHAFLELVVITGGTGSCVIDGCAHEARARTVFVIPPGCIHDGRGLDQADGWALLFLLDGVSASYQPGLSLLDDMSAGVLFDLFRQPSLQKSRPVELDPASYREVIAYIERMEAELAGKPAGYESAVRATLQLVLIGIARCSVAASAPVAGRAGKSRERDLLDMVFADIDHHFRGDGTLGAASHRLGFSPGYLTTRLRRVTGRTYGDWVIERKMIEARRLLATTNITIAAVGENLGYVETESFVRRFREHHGVTPASWREASRRSEQTEAEFASTKT